MPGALTAQCPSEWIPGDPRFNFDVLGVGYIGVTDLAMHPNGDLLAGGNFSNVGGVAVSNLAVWNGQTWAAVAPGADSPAALCVQPNGTVLMARNSGPIQGVRSWDGSSWQWLAAGSRVDDVLALGNGNVVAGGLFTTMGGNACSNIAQWDGVTWAPLGVGLPWEVQALAALPGGRLVAAGNTAVAMWDGTTWTSLGAVTAVGGIAKVNCLAVLANGDVVAGGRFSGVGGVSANSVIRWNGSAWSPLGAGIPIGSSGEVSTLAELPNGQIAAGGRLGLDLSLSSALSSPQGLASSAS